MMRELAIIAELNDIEVLGILDHHYYGRQDEVSGIPVIGDERWLLDKNNSKAKTFLNTCDFFPGNWNSGEQGNKDYNGPLLRLERINLLDQTNANVINLIHPDASVRGLAKNKYGNYRIGKGIQIHAGCYHSVDNVEIGDYSAFMSGNTVAHDVKIGRNVLVAPNTYLFDCEVKDNAYIGIYSRVNPIRRKGKVIIGENATVWHSAEVIKDVPDNCFYTFNNKIMNKRGIK